MHALQSETQAYRLARDIRTLTQWLSHDVLAVAGPALATRQELFDFIVEQLAQREPEDVRRIRPLRVALQNQRDDLLAFAGVLDQKLAHIGVSGRSEVAPCCASDEGRSLGAALQEEASNHHERLLLNGDGRERHGQKARLDRVRYACS